MRINENRIGVMWILIQVFSSVLVLLGLLSASPAGAVNNQWTSIGPEGGDIMSFAIDPINSQTVYAGGGGVFKTTTGGASWSPVNSGLPGGVRSLAVDPTNSQTVYAGTSNGVFKTTNGGDSWNAVNIRLTNTMVFALAIISTTPTTIYAGTLGGGVSKSTDGGISWNAVNTGLSNTNIFSLAIDRYNSQTIYAGTGGGVFKSTTGGSSWTAVNSGLSNTNVSSLAIDPTNTQTIYAGTGGGVFKSTSGGSTWSVADSGLNSTSVRTLAIDPASSQTVYAGTMGGVFKSTNGCASWNEVSNGLTDTFVWTMAINPTSSQTVYAGTMGGVFKSATGGSSWNAVSYRLNGTQVNSIANDPTNSQTIYAGTSSGMFKSTNGGDAWNTVSSGFLLFLSIDPTNSQTIYAGANGGMIKSTTGGSTWNSVSSSIGVLYATMAIDPTNSQTLYAGIVSFGSGSLMKSTTGGVSWSSINNGLGNTPVSSLAIDPTNNQTLYAGTGGAFSTTGGGGVFKSTTGGGSWTAVNTGLSNLNVFALAIDPINHQIIYAGTGGGAFKSTTGGSSWSVVNTGLSSTNVTSLAIDPTNNQILYAGTGSAFSTTGGGGVFKSTTGGDSWFSVNTGLYNTNVSSLAIDPTNHQIIYAGTAGGVFKTTFGATSTLNGLTISSGPTSVNEGDSAIYSATATWDDGSTSYVIPIWSVTPTTYAGINTSGLLTTLAVPGINQSVTIGASFTVGGVTKTASKSVTIVYAPALTSLTITGPASVNESSSAGYSATATWSDGSTTAVTPTWSVTPATYASISASGLLTTLAVPGVNQSISVGASYTAGGVTKTAGKTVTIIDAANQPFFIFIPNDPGIQGVLRSDNGNDATNLDTASGKPTQALSWYFLPLLKDPGGLAPQYVRLYLAQRAKPVAADFQAYDLFKVAGDLTTAAAYLYPTKLGPAAAVQFHYEAKLADGAVLRLPAAGELTGPSIQMLTGINFVGIPRDTRNTSLSAQDAFGTTVAYRFSGGAWSPVSSGLPVSPGEGYLILRQTATGALPALDSYPDVTDQTFPLPLTAGLNVISNPYPKNVRLFDVKVQKGSQTPVTMSDAITNGWIANGLFSFNGQDWGGGFTIDSFGAADPTLVPWIGYLLVLNKNDDTYKLVISKP